LRAASLAARFQVRLGFHGQFGSNPALIFDLVFIVVLSLVGYVFALAAGLHVAFGATSGPHLIFDLVFIVILLPSR
jgi:hypothetical protein